MRRMGGMQGLLGMLPGIGKVKSQIAEANLDDKVLKRQEAIISSMTKKERRSPDIIDGKRRKRIAAGSGTQVQDVNKLLKMHRQMADMMKQMGKLGEKGMMRGGLGALFGGGAGALTGSLPPQGLPQLGGGLPGLGGGLPGLPSKKR
jgi:signal recognition particle subunit SRP54